MKLYVKHNCPNSMEAIYLLKSQSIDMEIICLKQEDEQYYSKFSNNAPYLFENFEYVGGLDELKRRIAIED